MVERYDLESLNICPEWVAISISVTVRSMNRCFLFISRDRQMFPPDTIGSGQNIKLSL